MVGSLLEGENRVRCQTKGMAQRHGSVRSRWRLVPHPPVVNRTGLADNAPQAVSLVEPVPSDCECDRLLRNFGRGSQRYSGRVASPGDGFDDGSSSCNSSTAGSPSSSLTA
jgi:hypothetical protein